jgi:YD repeat-containing protein
MRRITRTHARAALLGLLLAALPLTAQLHPNLERGFAAEKAYQIGDIDHVNLFNGNLTLTIPLGTTLNISEQLSLNLTATYNSKLWEMQTVPGVPGGAPPQFPRQRPDRFSNAGFGWLVSLGRLIGPAETDVNPGGSFRYQGADGGIHDFFFNLHPNDAITTGVSYTRDGSYIRLRKSGSDYFIEFPDGVSQEYREWTDGSIIRYRLHATRDPRGNYYVVDYGTANEWRIRDQYDRLIVVTFDSTPVTAKAYDYKNFETAIKTITFPGFDGTTSTYTFEYEANDVRRGYCGQQENTADDPYVAAPFLKKITLSHGAAVVGAYEAAYDLSLVAPVKGTPTESCRAGTILSMKLPTQATVRWTYQDYFMPGDCRSELTSDMTTGLATRIFDSPGTGAFAGEADATWTYTLARTPETGDGVLCKESYHPQPPPGEMTNTVTSPAGDQTVHYFSIWPLGRDAGPNGEIAKEFGLPFSRRRASSDDATRFLSSKICKGPCSADTDIRRMTYIAYERDASSGERFEANRRMVTSRTVYSDDADRSVFTTHSGFDGVGHYRTTAVTGDFGQGSVSRTTTTNYNVRDSLVSNSPSVLDTGTYNSSTGLGFTLPSPNGPWILNTYSSVSSTDGTSSTKQYACFSPVTGDLQATRLLEGASPGSKDLLTVFERSAETALNGGAPGAVTAVSSYGGDGSPLQPTTKTALCDYVNASASTDQPRPLEYRTRHTYSYGSRATSTPYTPNDTAMPFKSLDLEIDPNSGLASSVYDTAGVETKYEYDPSARLTEIVPSGMATISYTYTPATSSTRAKVTVSQASTTGTVKREIHVDSMGRPTLEKKTVDSISLQSRTTSYDAMGWTTSVTEWGSTSATTFTDFDAFGRPGTITAPDGAVSTLSHKGTQKTRTSTYRSPGGNADTTVTENYDPLGRLVEVIESSGPTSATSSHGGAVHTKYGYDVADRLTTVDITPLGGTAQKRLFKYDARGLLTEETHPELGSKMTYVYDARGHATQKNFPGASDFDLRYRYDAAERLTEVSTRNGTAFRLSKFFDFGISGTANGRLLTAKRYNYLPGSADYYLVTEGYSYDVNGRYSGRDTRIDRVVSGTTTLVRSFSQSKTYNDLGLPQTIVYPQCTSCGSSARTLAPTYNRGFLQTIPGFIDDVDYTAGGMAKRIDHSNGTSDVITPSANGLSRPQSISFQGFCTSPQIAPQPEDQHIERNTPVTIIASVTGSPTLSYQWAKRPASTSTWTSVSTGPSLSVIVPEETYYRLTVTNGCGSIVSREIRVRVYDKPSISSQPASETISGGASAGLSVTAGGTQTLTYRWYQGSSGDTSQPIPVSQGTQINYSTGPLWATTSYWVRVSNDYGSVDSQTATITVQLAAPSGLLASHLGATSVRVTWSPSPGAGRYRVERLAGNGFVNRAVVTSSTLELTDTSVVTGAAYVYRVVAEDSNGGSSSLPSNQDFATVMSFSTVQYGTIVSDGPLVEILTGINALRSAANVAAIPLTWASLVGPPTPGDFVEIRSSPIAALQAQLNQARLAVGVPGWSFAPLDPAVMKAMDITQLQDGLK